MRTRAIFTWVVIIGLGDSLSEVQRDGGVHVHLQEHDCGDKADEAQGQGPALTPENADEDDDPKQEYPEHVHTLVRDGSQGAQVARLERLRGLQLAEAIDKERVILGIGKT